MGSEKINRLPEGVGKRIIESLKNQELETEYEEAAMPETDKEENIEPVEDYIPEEEEQVVSENDEQEIISETPPAEDGFPEINYAPEKPEYIEQQHYEEIYQEQNKVTASIADIDTLLNLISQLPSGVTKQTGALIIRQTMEAMGISMNKVLGDAQSVQEELENNIRNNVNVIEEYRTKIKILEQEIHKFRKKAHELEDIISLFILSDEKK